MHSSFNKYFSYAKKQIDQGLGMGDVMKEVLSAILASPRFLYLYDQEGKESAQPESNQNLDLASRLSFFLWGSLPDEELLQTAKKGVLVEEEQLSKQVDRLLNDNKLKRFCDSFPTQCGNLYDNRI